MSLKEKELVTILDVHKKDIDPVKRIIGLIILSMVPAPLITIGAAIAYEAYKEYKKKKEAEKK